MPETQGRLSLWGVETFLAVAEEGAITAAARKLGVSAPAVSQQISALESVLGVALFDRSARPFSLTPAGMVFRGHAQTMLNAELQARADLAGGNHVPLTQLKLGVIEDFDAEVTPVLLGQLSLQMPQTRFLLETGPSHRLLDQLESRALDVVVAAELGLSSSDTGWRSVHPLMTDPFVAVRPKSATDVPLILYSSRHVMGRQIAAHLEAQNLRFPVRFELDSYNAILALVSAGKGWTILSLLALHHARRFLDGVEVCPLPGQPLIRQISVSARDGVMGALAEQVVAALACPIREKVMNPMLLHWPWLHAQINSA